MKQKRRLVSEVKLAKEKNFMLLSLETFDSSLSVLRKLNEILLHVAFYRVLQTSCWKLSADHTYRSIKLFNCTKHQTRAEVNAEVLKLAFCACSASDC